MRLDKEKIMVLMARTGSGTADVIKNAGVTMSNWARIMRGGNTTPVTAGKIAKALDVDVTEILK